MKAPGLIVASMIALASLVIFGATPQARTAVSTSTLEPNAVVEWNQVAQNAIVVGRPPGSSAVLEGVVQAAMYDATIAIDGGYEPFVAKAKVSRPASTAAAIAAAARGVLVVRVATQAGYVEDEYVKHLAAIPDGPAKANGIAVGEQVAEAVLSWRGGDGFDNVVPFVQPAFGPGVFEPFPEGTTPVDVKLKQVRPLTLTSNDQFRPDGPSALTSAEYADDFNEVKAYGRLDSAVRTSEQTEIARFWSENSAIQWPRTQRELAVAKGLSLAETARMLALAQVSTADAILACFDAKYHYLAWRPVHAIRRAETDSNPATEADKGWAPLLVVNHPEYAGAHGCWTTAVAETLRAFFGTDKVAFAMFSAVTGTTHHYMRFRAAAKEVYDARTWAGLHFRNSTMEGAWIGRKIGRYVAANFFRPIGTPQAAD